MPAASEPSAGKSGVYSSHVFEALGTTCRLLFAAPGHRAAESFGKRMEQWVGDFESRYSRFRTDSLVSRINRAAGSEWIETDPELRSLFALCDWFHWQTRGIFDPTALPLGELWDWRARRTALPTPGQVAGALQRVGWKRVQRDGDRVLLPEPGMAIDLGGIGKEYAVDRVIEMARADGIENVLVDFGKDVRVSGSPPEGGAWRIGLEDPTDAGKCWAGVAVSDRAVASSGDYVRMFEADGQRYSHLIDPRTGWPAQHGCRSASVIAPTCTEAGVVAKTVMILGPEEGAAFLRSCQQVEGCIWADSGRWVSRGMARYLMT